MLKKRIKIIVSFGLFLMILSCGTLSTLKLDVLRPAEVTIDPEILSVVVVDNSLPFRGEGVHTVTTPRGTATIDTLWIDDFSLIAAVSMAEELKIRQFFDTVYFHVDTNLKTQLGRGNIPESMLIERIENLCDYYDVQAVILLESYRYKTKLSLLDLGDIYYGSMDVSGNIFWKMYDNYGNLLDSYMQSDSIFWDAAERRYSMVLNELPKQKNSVQVLAEYLGETYINRVSPFWETVSRKYYSKGHFLFARANDLHFINNWEEAAKVWYYVYQKGNKRQKALASFNIALSYEIRGDFSEAIAWGEISYKLFKKLSSLRVSNYERNIVKIYLLQLTERQRQKEKLDEQIGPL